MAIKFLVGTAEKYQQLKDAGQIVAENFYRISGTNDMYIGERKLTSEEDVQKALASIGTLSDLDTTTKTDLVAALNEIKAGVTNSAVTITAAASPTAGYLKTYVVRQGTTEVGKIDIPKDLVVTGGEIVTNPSGQAAGTYIKLTIANQTAPLYINVANLVDVYVAQAGAAEVQLAISDENIISATIVNGSVTAAKLGTNAVETAKIKDLNVTKGKLETAVQTSLGKADTAVQTIVSGSANGTISVDGANVAVKGLNSAAYKTAESFDTAGSADQALADAKAYTDTSLTWGSF